MKTIAKDVALHPARATRAPSNDHASSAFEADIAATQQWFDSSRFDGIHPTLHCAAGRRTARHNRLGPPGGAGSRGRFLRPTARTLPTA